MTDLTPQWEEFVRALRKEKGLPSDEQQRKGADEDGPQTPFDAEMAGIVKRIAATEAFLQENAPYYLGIVKWGTRRAGSVMSEEEKDNIESESIIFIQECERVISALQHQVSGKATSGLDQAAHQQGVVVYSLERLRSLAKAIDAQRTRRYQQSLEEKARFSSVLQKADDDLSLPFRIKTPEKERQKSAQSMLAELQEEDPLVLDEEEEAIFRAENQLLEVDLESELEDVRQVEAKMNEISSLLSVFSDKVLEQQEEIQNIYSTAVNSRSDMEEAGEYLTSAIKHSDDFVKYLVSFLVAAGSILLALDYFA